MKITHLEAGQVKIELDQLELTILAGYMQDGIEGLDINLLPVTAGIIDALKPYM